MPGPLALVGSGEYLPVLEDVVPVVDRVGADVEELAGLVEGAGLVGGPYDWEVSGRQSVWVLGPDGRTEHPSGSVVHTPG